VNGVALGHRYSIVRDVVNGKEHVTGNFGYLSNLGRVEGEESEFTMGASVE